MIGAKTTIAERARRNKDGSVKTRAEGTKRTCGTCKRELDESNFYFHKAEGKYDTYCRECRKAYNARYKKAEKEQSEAKRNGEKKKRERNPFLYRASELVEEVPDVISVQNAKGRIKEGEKVNINGREATVGGIYTNYVSFIYKNGSRESFGWDDIIRIITGASVECLSNM